MSSIRCATCGRVGPADSPDHEPTGSGAPNLFGASANAAWASFDGTILCPNCQSDAQRRMVTERTIAMIEREIERRQRQGVDSDPYEAVLIAYAMALRTGIDAERRTADESRSQDLTQSRDLIDGPLTVAFTGAFLTGRPLGVRVEDYDDVQAKLGAKLPQPQWTTESLFTHDATYDDTGGGFTKAVPLVIARRQGSDLLPGLSARLLGRSRPTEKGIDQYTPIIGATATGLAIDVYDLGVAVLTAWFDVVTSENAPVHETGRALKQLARLRTDRYPPSSLAQGLQDIAVSTAGQYSRAVTRALPGVRLPRAWLSDATPLATATADERPADGQGRLLWLHPVTVHRTDRPPERAERIALGLAPPVREHIHVDGGVFAAGIGASAVVTPRVSTAELTPIRLTELHWAYYALYMEIDRGLLRVLDQDKWNDSASVQDLERDAENVFADYLRVMNARARLDSELSCRGGDELAIWETIAKVQRFERVVESVERKLEVLDKVTQRRVAQANATRARITSDILAFLSLLTVVTVAGALIGIFLGSRSAQDSSITARVLWIVAAFAATGLVFWLGFIRTFRVPAPFAHRRRGSPG